VLIKRTHQHSLRHGSVAVSLSGQAGGLDRRSFLRKSGLAGGALAALGTLPLGSVRKAEAAMAGPLTAGATVRKSICTHCSVGCTVTAEVLNGGMDRPGAELGFPDQSRLALRQGRLRARARP
jgi:formate dehydrogenase major subunit